MRTVVDRLGVVEALTPVIVTTDWKRDPDWTASNLMAGD